MVGDHQPDSDWRVSGAVNPTLDVPGKPQLCITRQVQINSQIANGKYIYIKAKNQQSQGYAEFSSEPLAALKLNIRNGIRPHTRIHRPRNNLAGPIRAGVCGRSSNDLFGRDQGVSFPTRHVHQHKLAILAPNLPNARFRGRDSFVPVAMREFTSHDRPGFFVPTLGRVFGCL